MKKKFKDTKVGGLLSKLAPKVFDVVSSSFPAVGVVKSLISGDDSISVEDRSAILKAIDEDYEKERQYHLKNTDRASKMYSESKDITDWMAKNIMIWNIPFAMVLTAVNVLCAKYLDSTLLAVVAQGVGMIVQALLNERNTVTNFFMGSAKEKKKEPS